MRQNVAMRCANKRVLTDGQKHQQIGEQHHTTPHQRESLRFTASHEGKRFHLENGFANESGSKEVPERHEEMATADATQVECSIGPSCQNQNSHKAMPASQMPTLFPQVIDGGVTEGGRGWGG